MPRSKTKQIRPLSGGAPAPSQLGMKSQKRKRKQGAKAQSQSFGAVHGNSRLQMSSAPSSVGTVMPQSMFRFDGKAQAMTEYAGMGDSVRVCGTDLLSVPIQGPPTSSPASAGAFGGSYFTNLGPGDISPRLENLEELFQFYAFRELQLIFAPDVPTTTSGSVALGFIQDASDSADTTLADPTQQEVLEFTPSFKTNIYQPASFIYRHTGTKLWRTDAQGSSEAEPVEQCSIVGSFSSFLSTPAILGTMWVSYVLDFYKPSPVHGNPSRLRRHASRLIARAEKMEARLKKTGLEVKAPCCLETTRDSSFVSVSQDDCFATAGPTDGRRAAERERVELKTPAPLSAISGRPFRT